MKKLLAFGALLIFLSCSKNQTENSEDNSSSVPVSNEIESLQKGNDEGNDSDLQVLISNSKEELRKYYEIPFIKEFYEYELNMEFVETPVMEIPKDLSLLTYDELRLLRNEVYARNGYLFSDGFLRGYFNRFDWYKPIFNVDTFKVFMNQDEQDLVNRILVEENKRKEKKTFYHEESLELYNADLIVNNKQFKSIDEKILTDLHKNNFSIVDANTQMPFYIYDHNAYQYIPHYITTDLYLFILHKYFSKFLEKLDEKFMSGRFIEILNKVLDEVMVLKEIEVDAETLEWAKNYCVLALYAAGQNKSLIDVQDVTLATELENIQNEKGRPSFIPNRTFDYSELKPRGHYTKSDELKAYFKAFKWVSLNGIDLNNDEQLKGMLTLAFVIKSSDEIQTMYNEYVGIMENLAGQEDNLSLRDLLAAIGDTESYQDVISENTMAKVRKELVSMNKERVKMAFGEDFLIAEKAIKRVYFLSSTYSISGEIFSKLVHVNGNKSMRPFPKGMDIPAVFGNKSAEEYLINESKEGEKWADFKPRLKELQTRFSNYQGWKKNYGSYGLKTALSAADEQENYPDFMKTNAYNRKELSTTLSSWTHIKHDLILYQEKPFAYESGQGGGPDPPKHYSYVEPNIEFWNQALELAEWLKGFHKYDDTFSDELTGIISIGNNLRSAVELHLENQELPDELLGKLSWIGGEIEYILFGLLESDHLPEREKSMAIIADVYSYNGINLNVAVGNADEIYVVVPIRGEYHIARGAVFSYYEFTDNLIFSDEEWRSLLSTGNLPERPEWIAPLINRVPKPVGQMEYRYTGHYR